MERESGIQVRHVQIDEVKRLSETSYDVLLSDNKGQKALVRFEVETASGIEVLTSSDNYLQYIGFHGASDARIDRAVLGLHQARLVMNDEGVV